MENVLVLELSFTDRRREELSSDTIWDAVGLLRGVDHFDRGIYTVAVVNV